MNENFEEEMPAWAKVIMERVERLNAKMEETFPEPDRKKPDFSKLKRELDVNAALSRGEKTIF